MRGVLVGGVQRLPVGSTLSADLSVGDTALQVVPGCPWDEAGGTVTVGAQTLAYTGVSWADDTGDAFDSLTLSAASSVSATAGTVATTGEVVWSALVDLDGSGSPTRCDLAHGLKAEAQLGTRSGGLAVPCTVQATAGGYVVTDLARIDPSIDGQHLAAGTVPGASVAVADWASQKTLATLFGVTDLSGTVASGLTVQSAQPGGQRVAVGPAGFTVTDETGTLTLQGSPSGNFFSGKSELTSLTVDEGAELRGDTVIDPGGSLRLGSTLGAPSTPVQAGAPFPSISLPAVSGTVLALAWDGTQWVVLVEVSQRRTNAVQAWSIASDGGATALLWQGSTALEGADWLPGVGRLGGYSWVLAPGWQTYGFDGAGKIRGTVSGVPPTGLTDPACVGDDGTYLLVGWQASGSGFIVQRYDTSTGSLVDTTTLSCAATAAPDSISGGDFDYGDSTYRYVLRAGDDIIYVFGSDGTELSADEWPDAAVLAGKSPAALCWDGSAWWMLAADGTLYGYSTMLLGDASAPYSGYASNTWATDTAETPIGPQVAVTLYQRGQVALMSAPVPPSADRARFYVSSGGTDRTDFWRQTDTSGQTACLLTSLTFSGDNPVATSTFPAGTPAPITGNSGKTIVDGTYSNDADLDTRVSALEAGGGGGGSLIVLDGGGSDVSEDTLVVIPGGDSSA